MKVRVGQLSDITRLTFLARSAHEQSNFRAIPFNNQAMRQTFRGAVMVKGQELFVAERKDGSLSGFLIGQAQELPFSHRKYCTDGLFWAEQGGDRLLRAFLRWTQTQHACRVVMGVTQLDTTGSVRRLYERQGLAYVGGVYLKDFPLRHESCPVSAKASRKSRKHR